MQRHNEAHEVKRAPHCSPWTFDSGQRALLSALAAACCGFGLVSASVGEERACNGEFMGFSLEYDCDEPIIIWVGIQNNAWLLSETYTLNWAMMTPSGHYYYYNDEVTIPAGEWWLIGWNTGVPLNEVGTWVYGVDVYEGYNHCFYADDTLYTPSVLVTPSAPTGVTASDGTHCGLVRISWNAVSTAAYYKLYCDGAWLTDLTGRSWDHTTSSSHSYKVKACNYACGCSGYSSSDSGYPKSKPDTPTDVDATDGAYSSKVKVTWKAVDRGTEYRVYRDGSAVGSWQSGTTFYDTSVATCTTYSYRVKARNDCGESGLSSADSGYAGSSPDAPTGVSATDGADPGMVQVTWNSVSGGTAYRVYRNGSAVGSWQSGTTYDDNGVTPCVTYSYQVKARNECGESGLSSGDSGHAGSSPAAPTDVNATDGTYPSAVKVTWLPVVGATDYRVYRGGIPIGDWFGDTTLDDVTVAICTAYDYQVKARNDCGESALSASDTGYAGSVIEYPTDVAVTQGPDTDVLRLTWGAVAGADGYRIYRDGMAVSDWLTTTTFDDTDVALCTVYSYQVTARDGCGESARSPATSGHVAMTETCNGIDDDCDGLVDEGNIGPTWYRDADGDGFGKAADFVQACNQPQGYVQTLGDCDDSNPAVHPGATEICGDGLDNDCVGGDLACDQPQPDPQSADNDGDGETALTDCDDANPGVHHGAIEICDNQDNDCDGLIDEDDVCGAPDQDADGEPDATDCDPADPRVHHGAVELCDGIDNDCDGVIDEGGVCDGADSDGDGDPDETDCWPHQPWSHHGAVEECDGVDNDCDGEIDEDGACDEFDSDGDGDPDSSDCAPFAPSRHHGAIELCDNLDNDCDGIVDEGGVCDEPDFDGDGDPDTTDCDVFNSAIHHGAPELCDGVDNDCDGEVDEGNACTCPVAAMTLIALTVAGFIATRVRHSA